MARNRIKKVPLEDFITLLIELFDRGAEYVDISSIPDDLQDIIRIEVRQEYMREDTDMSFFERTGNIEVDDDEEIDIDINDLIV